MKLRHDKAPLSKGTSFRRFRRMRLGGRVSFPRDPTCLELGRASRNTSQLLIGSVKRNLSFKIAFESRTRNSATRSCKQRPARETMTKADGRNGNNAAQIADVLGGRGIRLALASLADARIMAQAIPNCITNFPVTIPLFS
jgi:hypothetical protein